MRKGKQAVGSYVLIKDFEQVKENLYKGIVHTPRYNDGKVINDDIVYFKYEGSILLPDNLIAIKYYEIVYKETEWIDYSKDYSNSFDNMGGDF